MSTKCDFFKIGKLYKIIPNDCRSQRQCDQLDKLNLPKFFLCFTKTSIPRVPSDKGFKTDKIEKLMPIAARLVNVSHIQGGGGM